MLTVRECADRACVCEGIVRSWIADGLLPHFRVGAKGRRGKIAVAVEDLDGLLASFKVGKAPDPVPKPPAPRQAFKHIRA